MADNPESQEETNVDLIAEIRRNPSETLSLMGHLYRGELDRATSWRSRLDQTTNWAVVFVAAILTWAFSNRANPHYVLLIGMFAVTGFLVIEAHRFREYDIWRSRVRTMQQNVFAAMLVPQTTYNDDWQRELSESLDTPTFTISIWESIGHRLRRTYLPLLLLLLVAWVVRITVFQPRKSWRQTAGIPGVSGETIVLVVAVLYLLAIGTAIWSALGTKTLELRK